MSFHKESYVDGHTMFTYSLLLHVHMLPSFSFIIPDHELSCSVSTSLPANEGRSCVMTSLLRDCIIYIPFVKERDLAES